MTITNAKPSRSPASVELQAVDRVIDSMTFRDSPQRPPVVARPELLIERILVAVDGTASSDSAISWAEGLARIFNASVSVCLVLASEAQVKKFAKRAGWEAGEQDLLNKDRKNGENIVKLAVARLESGKVQADGEILRGFPALEIIGAAQRKRADLVVLGSHGHGNRDRMLLGSVADAVKSGVSCHVLVAKGEFRAGNVLLPVDGSEPSRLAVSAGLRIGRAWTESVTILHAFEVPLLGYESWGQEDFERILKKFNIPERRRDIRYVLDFGKPAQKILAHAATGPSALIIMGSRGIGGLRSLLAGSVSNRVAHEARTSVLLVKRRRPRSRRP